MKQNNRGMTLIEMIVAFAILGIVSTSIFSMLLTGTKTYTKLTTTVKLQHQAQVATSNIERRILNCNGGLTYRDDQNALFIITEKPIGVTEVQKDLQVVYLDESTGQLFLATKPNVADGIIPLEFNLLAENVNSMTVTLDSNSGEVDRASLTLEFTKTDINGNEIKQTLEKTIALRNHPSATYSCSLGAAGADIVAGS